MKKKILSLISLVTLFVLMFPLVVLADFSDSNNSSNGFGGGANSNTQWDSGNSWLELDSTGLESGSGTFTSRIMDSGGFVRWPTLSWVPTYPSNKELPNNATTETSYSSGNIDMSFDTVLLHFNESGSATSFIDSSGRNYNSSCSGDSCPSATTGLFNGAFNFDGQNDEVDIPAMSKSELFGGVNFSLSFWVNPGSTPDKPTFGFLGSGGYNANNPFASYDSWLSVGNGSTYQLLPALPDAPANKWSNYVIVSDGTDYIVYLNGVEKSRTAITFSPEGFASRQFVIGRSGFGSDYDDWFNGKIDDFTIIKRAFSQSDAAGIYNRGIARLKFQVRSCDDDVCSGESFVGPDGTSGTYFSELTNQSVGLPSKNISQISIANRYFQYKAFFENDDPAATVAPQLMSVSVATGFAGDNAHIPEFSNYVYVFTVAASLLYMTYVFKVQRSI